ncbi:hypothetical protein P22_3245 [Propionispora sp. 2/2-37]|nr:hypothetical protein P22_3245 [Propionispora sp. 2/2-37]
MKIKNMKIADLKPAKYNPRKDLKPGDVEYEQLKKSILAFGYVDPIIVNGRNNVVIGGHQRLKVLAELGNTTVDVSVVDLDEKNEKALNVALNKISGEWDMPMLQDILLELNTDGFDMDAIGFSLDELPQFHLEEDEGESEASEDDFDVDKAVENSKEPVSKPGDLWLLGRHRLLCGDATRAEDVRRLMDGKRASMIWTDPPWNVDYGASKHPSWKPRQILNDSMTPEKFHDFLLASFRNMRAVSEAGCMTYVAMSAQEWGNLMSVMHEAGYHWSSTIIWVKDSLVLSRKDYHTQYEPIWYGWVEGTRLCPLEDRKQSDVWEIPRPKRSDEHPTMKPISLVARAIQNSSRAGDIVIDLFGGSGSTLIAAEQVGHTCYTMELDPVYADVIVARYIAQAGDDKGVFLLRNGVKKSHADVAEENSAA